MEHDFFSFHIDYEDIILDIVPIEFYNVNYSVRYVCMYKLSIIHKKDSLKNHISIIPYYVSNGQTNKIRANLIFPFMCYSDWNNQGICPFFENSITKTKYKLNRAVLLKYHIGPNFEINKLENQVIENFIKKQGAEFEEVRRNQYQQLYIQSNNFSKGLPSVLPRLSNFMDFVLCIINQNIINFNPEVDNIYCFRPLLIENDQNYIDMKKCNEQPNVLNSEDDYRFVLLTILNRFANLIMNHTFIDDIRLVRLKAIPISLEDFNKMVKTCEQEYIIKNTTSYFIISQEFRNIFKKRINEFVSQAVDKDITPENRDLIFLDNILSSLELRNPYFIYKDHLSSLKMDCSKSNEDENDEIVQVFRMD